MNAIAQIVKAAELAAVETKAAQAAKAEKNTARRTRPAQKPVTPKTASVVTTAAKALPIKFVLNIRPAAGEQLSSFTHAYLDMLGMFNGATVSKSTLQKIAGDRAVAYHLTTTGTMEMTDSGVKLSDFGMEFFKPDNRKIAPNPETVKKYQEIFKTGKIDGELVKSALTIKALSA